MISFYLYRMFLLLGDFLNGIIFSSFHLLKFKNSYDSNNSNIERIKKTKKKSLFIVFYFKKMYGLLPYA